MGIIIDILLIESRVNDLSHCEQGIEKSVEELCEIPDAREGILNVGKEHDEGDDNIFPAIEDEEI